MRFCFFLFLFFLAQPSFADKPKLSGISWGGYRYPNSLSFIDEGNTSFETTIIIRADFGWHAGRGDLIPYLSFFSQNDSLGYVYNSKQKFSVGISSRYKIKKYAQLSFGARYDFDYRPLTGLYFHGPILTADFSYYRSKPKGKNARVILSGWSNARFPGSVLPADESNLIIQGAMDYVLERPIGKSKFRAAAFVGLGFAVDTDKNDYNNKQQLDFGFRVKRKVKKMDLILSVKYRLENRSITGDRNLGPVLGVSWLSLF